MAAQGPSVNCPLGTAAALLRVRSHNPARPATPSASGTCGKEALSLPAELPCQDQQSVKHNGRLVRQKGWVLGCAT